MDTEGEELNFEEFNSDDVKELDLDFEEWKEKVAAEIEQQASNFSHRKINRRIYYARKLDETVEKCEEDLKADPDNQNLKDKYEYFKGLTSALVTEMFRISPVECIAEIQRTALPEEKQLTREDIEKSIYSFVYSEICRNKIDENVKKLTSLKQTIQDNPKDEKAKKDYEKLEKQYGFYLERAEISNSHIHSYIDNIISHIHPTLDLENLSSMHSQYLSDLVKYARENQLEQEELLARYENGELADVSTQVEKLQNEFENIFYERKDLKRISTMIPSLYHTLDLEQIDYDDFTLSATGDEAFNEMNKKQRYHSKVKAYEIKQKMERNKRPSKFRKLLLHLPNKKMDELIKQYIDEGRLPLEEVMGCSQEELLVRMEARKLAQKMREDKKAESEKSNQEELGGQAQGEAKEHEETEPKPAEEQEGANIGEEDTPLQSDSDFDVEAKADEMVKLLNELSVDARIDFLMETFNLPEENREILVLFESLSPEAREEICKNYINPNRDEVNKDTKEEKIKE